MRAVVYARVSSKAQKDRHTIDSQLRDAPAFIASQGWTLVRPVDTYVDDGRTAKAGHLGARNGFQRLAADATAGAFDVVVVVDLDRLTRSEDLAERGAILGAFQSAGVRIASSSSGQVLDLSSDSGDLYAGLAAFFAAQENRKRRARTLAGKETALAKGKKPAGPTPFGLAYDRETGAWSIDEPAAEIVREIFRRVIAGEPCAAIADDLTDRGVKRPRAPEWIRERVYAIVVARTYAGEWTANKARRLVLKVPAIVDEGTWQRAQDVLKSWNRRGIRRTKHVYLIEDLAVCGICNARMGIASAAFASRTRVPSPARYVCAHRRQPPRGSPPCELPLHRVADIDGRLWRALTEMLSQDDLVERVLGKRRAGAAAGRADWESDAKAYRSKLARLERTEAAVLARFRRGAISEGALDIELAAVGREREMLRRQLETAERGQAAEDASAARAEVAESLVARLRERAREATLEQQRELVQALFERGTIVVGVAEIRAVVRLVVGSHAGLTAKPLHGDEVSTRIVPVSPLGVELDLIA